MFNWHELSAQQVLRNLDSSPQGLSVNKIKKRLEKYGLNELPKKPPAAWFIILLEQFKSPFMYILLFAALVSLFFSDYVDAGVIVAAIVLNTVVGFVQEYKASRALAELRSMVRPEVVVRRDSQKMVIPASQVVPGDILILESGDRVAADARLIEENTLEINEAALTGESLPIEKQLAALDRGIVLADRTNMVYAGTEVGNGRGLAVVVATGIKTELGQIAELVKETKDEETPLQVQLRRLAKILTIIFVGVAVVIFVIGVLGGRSVFEMFITSVALAVAAVPEGLLVAVTVILAIGMQRILRQKALVRRLIATETLGSVSVICTDKTGTITEARMKATELVGKDKELAYKIAVLCNNSTASGDRVIGSPTEAALMRFAVAAGQDKSALDQTHPRLAEIPFNSAHKYMATLNEWGDSNRAVLVKGAPEKILPMCNESGDDLMNTAHEMSKRGLRVLAVAYKKVGKGWEVEKDEDNLGNELSEMEFVGFFGLQDPIRPDAKETIAKAAEAGVRTVIITGDHPDTAVAIAKEAGLDADRSRTLIGSELDQLSDEELQQKVKGINVYARVEPAHKVRIVNAWKEQNEVVSMTGDGVNDAPALKAADIGVALGTGTEVAKSTSEIVLLNNALTTIVKAIEQGRVIYDNIRKVTTYLLVDSFTEIVLIGTAVMLGLPLPLLAAQILWINLITDGFPSLALTLEPGEPDVMKEPPRPRKEAVLNKEMKVLIFIIGILTDIGIMAIFLYLLNLSHDIEYVRSIIFTAVAIDSLIYVFAIKSFRHSIFHTNIFNNKWLVMGVIAGLGLQIMAVTVPFFQNIFEITHLHLYDWLLLISIGCVKLVAIEIVKWIFIARHHHKKITA